ncbi:MULTISPECIES: M15 family metallopeptidase [Variovorax]|jgi:hypothetical protein|uniref:M15 family metallopeptidase n=1 Tax=Variovorax TaxID=34072 RepID=UPI00086D8FB7|nr:MULTISPECIES: M15 family metallopeptidase [Variovorax]MBN8751652.1 M15 family metallopeptidase [Variovorax sp.]ODU11950.1 MAG: hypothetical protein ABS94_35040 [Variovorax sp. SCN 67-85]ODV14688.1 MAG: hypothetical protein ABT25_32910 [Variovorax sp. SCN 67-20]OJZ05595.1 MAG: hypothetical protein BGP22_12710 [Variovorax sp. 67-131]UKI04947.1 M15 family metallopeptidase [Variovorax paradoxus]
MNYELHYRDEGADVRRLQEFLVSLQGAELSPDGLFGPNTRTALLKFQSNLGLGPTGFVDADTFDALAHKGLVLLGPIIAGAEQGTRWPPRAELPPQPSAALTTRLFGEFEFRHAPTARSPEDIEILGDWVKENIVQLHVPQLDKGLFAASSHYVRREVGTIRCHRKAAAAFLALFSRWEDAGLMDRVLTCAGAFNARLRRGLSDPIPANLSNHAWGTAIDLNATENPRGHVPPGVGARGSVRELVQIANGLGFFWGGHFSGTPDGMHFELAQLP